MRPPEAPDSRQVAEPPLLLRLTICSGLRTGISLAMVPRPHCRLIGRVQVRMQRCCRPCTSFQFRFAWTGTLFWSWGLAKWIPGFLCFPAQSSEQKKRQQQLLAGY